MAEDRSTVKIRPREEGLHKMWQGSSENVPVNNQQYSFDSIERQEEFTKAMFITDQERARYDAYRMEWYRRAKEFDPGTAPLAVCCELVSCCNLQCPMCYSITEEFQSSVVGAQRQMPWQTVKAIIDECTRLDVPSMLFSWRGESSLYSSVDEKGKKVTFPDVLAYARKAGILEITSLTNGHKIDDRMAMAIVEAQPSWISFSLDGLRDNYNKIRTPVQKRGSRYDAFGEVTGNIKRMVEFRNKLGKTRPQIRTNTIYPPIAVDPIAYYEFMKELGVGWVTVNELLDFRGDKLPEEAILKDWACQYPFQRLTVSANGSILPCTGAHNEERDMLLGRYIGSSPKKVTLSGREEIIDIPESTIKEAWHSESLRRIRELHKAKKRCDIPACRNCRHGAVKKGVEWVPAEWDLDTMEWKGHEWRE